MATITQMSMRLVDLFGSPATADPTKLLGNLTVSPGGRVLVGTSTDDGSNKLQVTGNAKVSGTLYTGSNIVQNFPTADVINYINGGVAKFKATYLQSNGSSRWLYGSDNAAESGSNAGTNFIISRYTDAGAWIDNPMSITRSSGQVNFAIRPSWAGVTPWDAGNLNPMPVGGGTFTGAVTMTGAVNSFYCQHAGSQSGGAFRVTGDIGNSWVNWNNTASAAVQIDAPNSGSAYYGMRWTQWGARHLAAIGAYGNNGSTAYIAFLLDGGTGPVFSFFSGGNATFSGALTQNSDYRIKTNLSSIDPESALAGVLKLAPIEYDRTDTEIELPRQVGFLAHEVQEVFPLLVKGEKDAVKTVSEVVGDKTPYLPGEEPEGYVPPVEVEKVVPDLQSVNYAQLSVYQTAAIQALSAKLEAALGRIAELEEKLK